MDYGIYLLSRICEEYQKQINTLKDTNRQVLELLEATQKACKHETGMTIAELTEAQYLIKQSLEGDKG